MTPDEKVQIATAARKEILEEQLEPYNTDDAALAEEIDRRTGIGWETAILVSICQNLTFIDWA